MKFYRSNKFNLCYNGQENSLRLKSSFKWASKQLSTLGGIIYFAGQGTNQHAIVIQFIIFREHVRNMYYEIYLYLNKIIFNM